MLCHMLRVLGYNRGLSLESFRNPNFKLIADILFWLCDKMDPSHSISPNINGETERIIFLKNALGLLVSKTRENIDSKAVYYSDHRAVPELLKLVSLLYKGHSGEEAQSKSSGEFTLPHKFNKRKTKDLAKEITQHGMVLYDLLGKETKLDSRMDWSIQILEQVLKDYNTSSGSIERHVKKLISDQKESNEEIQEYLKTLEKKEKDIIDRIRRKQMEAERQEKKLKTLSNIKPAYLEDMERAEKEL